MKITKTQSDTRSASAPIGLLFLASITVSSTYGQWMPPVPAEPNDTTYTSPFTFATLRQSPSGEAGPKARMAARWQLFGGPISMENIQAMARVAARERQLNATQLHGGAGIAGMPAWNSLGPTKSNHFQNGTQPVNETNSGRLRAILAHPTNPDIVYVLAAQGGLWKTSNFSAPKPDWNPKSDAIGTTSGGAVAFGKNPNTLYLGTGDPFDGYVGGYMVRSTDGGDNWSVPAFLLASSILDVQVDTAGAIDTVLVGSNNGLFRSTDGGGTYAQAAFAGSLVWSIVRTSAGWLASVESSPGTTRLYLSADKGQTWSVIPNAGNVFSGAGRTTLGVGAAMDAVVYAFAATTFDSAQLDLFRSSDGGRNWLALGLASKTPANNDYFQRDMNIMADQAFYNQMLLVDPSDAARNTVYIGGQLATAKSTDGGASWALTSTWLPLRGPTSIVGKVPYVHADLHCAAYIPGKKPAILFGGDGGIFVSTDNGATWDDRKNEGLVTHLIYAMGVSAKRPDSMLIGLQDNGTSFRQPNSTNYNGVIGGDGFGAGWSQANDFVSIGSVYFSILLRSINNPPNVEAKFADGFAGINQNDAGFFTPLTTPAAIADPTGGIFLSYTFNRVYRTTDGAASWVEIGNKLAGGNIAGMPSNVRFQGQHGLGVSPVTANRMSVTAGSGYLAITVDGGSTWTARRLIGPTGVPGYGGVNVTSAWGNNQVIYVGSQSPTPSLNKIVRSDDAGATWAIADIGLPRVPVIKIVADPRDTTGKTAFAGTAIGVYRTTNGGNSWTLFGNGLPQVVVSDLYMPEDGSFLRISTYGRGVWEARTK